MFSDQPSTPSPPPEPELPPYPAEPHCLACGCPIGSTSHTCDALCDSCYLSMSAPSEASSPLR